MIVHVLIHRDQEFASPYVGRTYEDACRAFCQEFLDHHFASNMEDAVLDENYDGAEEPEELVQAWKLLRAGKWTAAVGIYSEYIRFDGEEFLTEYKEEVYE